jgi:hypothetical protein
MSLVSIECLAATSPPFFKAIFLTVVALVIPGFFVAMWLMSHRHKQKKSEIDKKGD